MQTCVIGLLTRVRSEMGRAKAEAWSFLLFRYEAAHPITREVSLRAGVASQHMWTTLICCCLQCLWQRWQTSLCASEKPERHNAEWKFGAVGTVGVPRLRISPFLWVGGCCTRVCGGNGLSHRLAFWATQWVKDSVVYSTRKPGTLEELTNWTSAFFITWL